VQYEFKRKTGKNNDKKSEQESIW